MEPRPGAVGGRPFDGLTLNGNEIQPLWTDRGWSWALSDHCSNRMGADTEMVAELCRQQATARRFTCGMKSSKRVNREFRSMPWLAKRSELLTVSEPR